MERRLRALGMRNPELREAAEVYGALLSVIKEAPDPAARAVIAPEEAAGLLAQGLPLLCRARLDFNLDAIRLLAVRLAKALEESGVARAAPVRQALAVDRLPMEQLLRYATTGDCTIIAALAARLAVDAALLDILAQYALRPALRAWNRQLAPLVRAASWERGHCPVCGVRAALAELQGPELSRHLRCGRCGADWSVRRILCPFCRNEDPATLGFLRVGEGPGEPRIEFCDRCRRYIKVVTRHDPGTPDEVIVDDLETLPLDHAARARGYRSEGDRDARAFRAIA